MMKNKKIFILAAVMTVLSAALCFAQGRGQFDADEDVYISKGHYGIVKNPLGMVNPKKGVCCYVGKIIVNFDKNMDRDFIYQTRAVSEKLRNRPDRFYPQVGAGPEYTFNFGENFCLGTYTNKERKLRLSKYTCYISGSRKAHFPLPLYLEAEVPEGEGVVYLGTVIYDVSSEDFTIKSIRVVDEYDEAREYLTGISGKKQYDLCRVEWKPYEPKEY